LQLFIPAAPRRPLLSLRRHHGTSAAIPLAPALLETSLAASPPASFVLGFAEMLPL